MNMQYKNEHIINKKSQLQYKFISEMRVSNFVLGQDLIKPFNVRQFSSSSTLYIDEDINTDNEPKTESIEDIKKRLDEMREKIDELEKVRFSNRVDKTAMKEARKLTDYIQDHNEMLTYYLEGEIKYVGYETQREVSLKLQDMGKRIKAYEDEAFEIYMSPKENQYPDRDALCVLNNLNKMMRRHLMFCRDKVYGTPLEPTDSINPYKDHNKELFKELERQRDLYLHQSGMSYVQEDAKRMRRDQAGEGLAEKQAEFETLKDQLDKLAIDQGVKKVKFVDDVPKDLSSSSSTYGERSTTIPKKESSITTPEKESSTSTPEKESTTIPEKESSVTVPKKESSTSTSGKESSTSTSEKLSEKDKGKAKESLIDDFADPNMEMPDYIDPDG